MYPISKKLIFLGNETYGPAGTLLDMGGFFPSISWEFDRAFPMILFSILTYLGWLT